MKRKPKLRVVRRNGAERAPEPEVEDVDGAERETPQPIAIKLEDVRAYAPMHNYICIPTRELWPVATIDARFGKIDKLKASTWLDQNRSVEQMTWAPGEDLIIDDRVVSDGGWSPHPGLKVFNLYRGPTIERGDGSVKAVKPWLDLVARLYPNEVRHIVRWCAHRVQHPGVKINHALVLGGDQGIGKDSILEPVKVAVGPWNFKEVSPMDMFAPFNPHVKSVILRVSEARDLGDVDRFKFYEHLKPYLASPPEVLRCNEKNIKEHQVFNVCSVVMTTNHRTSGIYLPAGDRRHFVAWSEAKIEDRTKEYWATLHAWYEREGFANVAAYLRKLDLSKFDPKAPPRKTPTFWQIVDANRAPEDAELTGILDLLGKPDAVTVKMIVDRIDFCSDFPGFRAWLCERRNFRMIPHRFEEVGYMPVRNDWDKRDGLWLIAKKRVAIYAKAELSVRDRLAAASKLREDENAKAKAKAKAKDDE